MNVDLATDQEMKPGFAGTDFEEAEFDNIRLHFPTARLVGCNFHAKQAWRRMLIKMGFPEDEIAKLQ